MWFLISLQSDPEDFVLHSLGEFVYLEICKKIMWTLHQIDKQCMLLLQISWLVGFSGCYLWIELFSWTSIQVVLVACLLKLHFYIN